MNNESNDKGLAVFDTDSGQVKLSPEIVRKYLVSGGGDVTNEEIVLFMKLCVYQKLNPFLKEAYLIKYGSGSPATMVVGKDVFTKRAVSHPDFDGIESGVVVQDKNGQVTYRDGALVLDGEKLVGGWAKVYSKARRVPVSVVVNLEEYIGRKKDGSVTKQWETKKPTMIVKVAKSQAYREAYPEKFQGLYSAEEFGYDAADTEPAKAPPKGQDAPEAGKRSADAGKAPPSDPGHRAAPSSENIAPAEGQETTVLADEAPQAEPPKEPGEDDEEAKQAKKATILAIFSACKQQKLNMADLRAYLGVSYPSKVSKDEITWPAFTLDELGDLKAAVEQGTVTNWILANMF